MWGFFDLRPPLRLCEAWQVRLVDNLSGHSADEESLRLKTS